MTPLDMAVQTVSAQVRTLEQSLEQSLGHALFKSSGRKLVLTEAGRAALRYAEQIFELGGQLAGAVRDAPAAPQVRFSVGTSDGLPKPVVRAYSVTVIGSCPGVFEHLYAISAERRVEHALVRTLLQAAAARAH